MKKIFYTLLAGAMSLSSCSKSDDVPTAPQGDATTFTIAVDGAETRATVTPARYIMEVWSEDGTTAENVFENGTKNHAEITSGNAFTVTLDKTKAYTCLFWADDNDTFNAENLKAISLNADKEMAEAYFANVAVTKGKNPAVAVTLKRAVAKITLTETATVETDVDLVLKFSNIYPTFSVLGSTATGTAAEWTKTIKPSATTGVIASFYLFAKAEKALSDLKFTYATETEKTVSNIPIQQNHATSIKGEFSNMLLGTFTISADDEWTTPNNDVEFGETAKVGDFYYSDNTFSNTINTAKTCIGIVYVVNADGKTGKIVSLTEATGKNWGASVIEIADGINSTTDGATATKNLIEAYKDTSDFATNYPAFEWVYTTVNNSNIDGRWYIPAKEELKALYGKYNGDTNVDNSVKAAVNASLSLVSGATTLYDSPKPYWSSTQSSEVSMWCVNFGDGSAVGGNKNSKSYFRVVSTF